MDNVICALLMKDFKLALRARELLLGLVAFSVSSVVVASFSFRYIGYGEHELLLMTPGILWLIFLFASTVFLNQSFEFEREEEAVSALALLPFDSTLVFWSKTLTNTVFLILNQVLVLFVHGILFGAPVFSHFAGLVLIILLASFGFSCLGTLLSSISVRTKGREIVLPMLFFPMSLPLLAASVFLTRELLVNSVIPYTDFWFVLLCVYDVIVAASCSVLFEYVLREV